MPLFSHCTIAQDGYQKIREIIFLFELRITTPWARTRFKSSNVLKLLTSLLKQATRLQVHNPTNALAA